jgi:signal transduction histidine kinase
VDPDIGRFGGHLRPRARLIHTIGSELISSSSVALVELVKNAYDADASKVLIRVIADADRGAHSLEVLDDGTGMTSDTLLETWLDIATPNRRRATRSRIYGRRVLGEKGIGRFAAGRLGDGMTITSRATGSATEVTLLLDWSAFRDEDRYLDEIDILWEEAPASSISADPSSRSGLLWRLAGEEGAGQGTLIRLEELADSWTRKEVEDFKRDLSRLVAPQAGLRKGSGFSIYLLPPEDMDDLGGLVTPPELLYKPHYRLSGTVSAEGVPDLTIELGTDDPTHLRAFTRPLEATRDGTKLACGPLKIELRVWDRDRLDELTTQDLNKKAVQQLLDQAAGVSVYRDGFRLLPYGEVGDDWLGLDRRRVQNPTLRLSNNQVVGAVDITIDANPELRDQSNREGLVAGPAYNALVATVTAVLNELEFRRRLTRRREETPRPQPRSGQRDLFARLSLTDVVDLVRSRHPDDEQLLSALDDRRQRAEEDVAKVKETLARFSGLALIGRLVDDIIHDGQAAVGKIRNSVALASRSAVADPAPRLKVIGEQAAVLASLFNRVSPFGGRTRGRPRQIGLRRLVEQCVDVLQTRIQAVQAQVEFTGEDTTVTLDPVEVQQVVVNLIDNALHWVAGIQGDRIIRIEMARPDPATVSLTVSDNGPGVPPENREAIFEPYFSTRDEGTGLGLAIAGTLLADYYDGELELIDGDLPGASFRATFRRRT